jgi:hypothetical protein
VTVTAPVASRRCVGCNRIVQTPYCTHCGLDAHGCTSDPEIGPDVAVLLRRLNVGAGLGAGIWTFGNGAPVLGALFWLTLLFLPPVAIGIMVYLLINGNRVALQRRRFTSIERFRSVQRGWTIAVLGLTATLIVATIGLAFLAGNAPASGGS